ncbi:MAG: zinc ribbon domain-containing protein [Methanobrevibacter ruminantium]|uniref:zinc ribbon domain-containing protein n=1 Tax=Methanobrevibacter ruminantium TaxID=83816 RepID=UPI002D807A01|nr:zinc ribbon domain-containing protein [Methanobrevibacter ruminantium]MCI5737289.1 zinc ribbon domain-containing protein [Methanobrevibacter ruminantium]
MFCPNCNRTYDDFNFCPTCGKKLVSRDNIKKQQKQVKETKINKQNKSSKNPKTDLYDYLNRFDNVKNGAMIKRRIQAGEITSTKEIDKIILPNPRLNPDDLIEELKNKEELLNFVDELRDNEKTYMPYVYSELKNAIKNGYLTSKEEVINEKKYLEKQKHFKLLKSRHPPKGNSGGGPYHDSVVRYAPSNYRY